MPVDVINTRLRRFLLGLAGLALLVTTIELWLVNHFQQSLQLIPWVLCGLGFLAVITALLRPGRAVFNTLRGVMALVAVGGLLGIAIHLKENFEFQQEIHPNVAATDSFIAAFKGAAPLLAPGSLIFAALIAIAATYQHPALKNRSARK